MDNLVLSSIAPERFTDMIAEKVTANVLKAIEARRESNPLPAESEYITRKDVCRLLHISLPTVHSWIKSGKLKAYHVGGRTLFRESEVLETVKPAEGYQIK